MRRLVSFLSALALASTASAAVIWSDDYTEQTVGSFPSRDFAGGAAGNDYINSASATNATTIVTDAVGNPGPSMMLNDGSSSSSVTNIVTMSHFAPFEVSATSATPILRISFDFRVDSYSGTTSSHNSRFILRANNETNTGFQVVVGFGHATLNDGDALNSDLALYADTQTGSSTSLVPKNTSAIGLNAGTGWAPGFDFGSFNTTSGSDNDTNDEFYRIVFEYSSISGSVSGNATRLSTGEVGQFQLGLAMNPGLVFNNNSDDRFLVSSNTTNFSETYFDNFVFEAVPEPASGILLCGGMVLLGHLRRWVA